jgi:hypothetical protein
MVFSSILEKDTYLLLKKWADLGLVSQLRQQSPVLLTRAKVKLVADFSCFAMGLETIAGTLKGPLWVEAKGVETPVWRIKRKLWQFYGPSHLLVYKRAGRRGLVLDEVIIPKITKES